MSLNHLYSVIPEYNLNLLHQAGVDRSRAMWTAGDQNNYLCEYVFEHKICDENGNPYMSGDINRFVGEIVGVRSRRIRDYAMVCKRFDLPTREKYDVLPFSHFEFAVTHPGRETDILEISIRRMEETGRPPSVEWLEYNCHDLVLAAQTQMDQLEGDNYLVPIPSNDDDISPDDDLERYAREHQGEATNYILRVFRNGLTSLRYLIGKLILSEERREKALSLLEELEAEILSLAEN